MLTSSIAAVLYGRDRDHVFTEADWSNVDDKRIGAYEKSKTIAERAAWDYMASLGDGPGMDLVSINPGLVLGPILSSDYGTSGELVKKILDRDFPAIPDINYAMVDVRDVAAAHVAALGVPEAGGRRFICAIENHSMREVAQILADHFDGAFKVPTGKLPGDPAARRRPVGRHGQAGAQRPRRPPGRRQHADSRRAGLATSRPARDDRVDGRLDGPVRGRHPEITLIARQSAGCSDRATLVSK